MSNINQGERIMRLETQIAHLTAEQSHMNVELDRMNSKLDELIGLRNKGMGVFWLASALFGGGLFGVFTALSSYFRG